MSKGRLVKTTVHVKAHTRKALVRVGQGVPDSVAKKKKKKAAPPPRAKSTRTKKTPSKFVSY